MSWLLWLRVKAVVDVLLYCDWLLSTRKSWCVPQRHAHPAPKHCRVCKLSQLEGSQLWIHDSKKWSKQFDIRPHHCRRRTVQPYSPGGANVPSHEGTLAPPGEYDWTCASFGPLESTTLTANPLVQPFLYSSEQNVVWHARACPFP